MVKVKYIPNILSKENRREASFPYERDKTISDYLTRSGFPFESTRVVVSGCVVKDLNSKLQKGDEILILPATELPIVAAVAWAFNLLIAAAFAHPFIAAFAILSIGFGVYSALSAARVPLGNGDGIDSASQTYSWDGIQTTQEVGTPVPLVFGTHRVGGNIIDQNISTDGGGNNWLNLLLGLCEGEIDSVSGIEINQNPLDNYENITIVTSPGTNTDAPIPGFQELDNLYNINANVVNASPFVYTTINNDTEAFEVYINFPNGLYYDNPSDGSINPWEVDIELQYRLNGTTPWTNAGVTAISQQTESAWLQIIRVNLPAAGKYDIKVTRTSVDTDFYHQGDSYLQQVNEIKTDQIAYVNTAKLAITIEATNQLSGDSPNVTALVRGMKVLVPNVLNSSTLVVWDDYYWDPNLQKYRLLADDTVLSWDGTTMVRAYSANPVWCIYELLTNVRFGLGNFISTSNIKFSDYVTMSQYCEEKLSDGDGGYEKRFRLDVVIDSAAAAPDVISQLATVFNAWSFYSEGLVKLKIDKPDSPVQLFGMGNIIQNSFQQTCKSLKDVYTAVTVQFLNQDMDYVQDSVTYIDQSALAAGAPVRSKTIRIFTTKTSYAVRAARYALWVAKYVNRSIAFSGGADAVVLDAGDLFDFSHDVPQWGFSGRVTAGTTSSVTLDQEVVLDVGESYAVEIKFADGTMATATVTNSAGSYSVLNVSPNFPQSPQAFDNYAFGPVNRIAKTFRALSMQRLNKGQVTISGLEYNPNIYDDSDVVVPITMVSTLDPTIPKVTNLVLKENPVNLNDGTIQDVINVYWTPPNVTNPLQKYAGVKVYLSADNGNSWKMLGETSGNSFPIGTGISVGNSYLIAAVSVTASDAQNLISASPQASITTTGKDSPPNDVIGLAIDQNNNILDISWDAVPDRDLARYVIKEGASWETAILIAEKVDVTKFSYTIDEVGPTSFLVKAVDTSGNESVNPAVLVFNIEPPPNGNFLLNLDPWAANREYSLINIAKEAMNLFDPSYMRDVYSLITTNTYEQEQQSGKGWDQAVAAGDLDFKGAFQTSGSIQQPTPFDLGYVFSFNIILDMLYKNIAGGTLAVQVATSVDNVTWSSFANVDGSATYRARYLKFQYFLTCDGTNNLLFYGGSILISAPNLSTAYWQDVSVPVGGVSIPFGTTFTTTPRITSLIVKGAAAVPEVISIDPTQITVKVKDLTNTYIGTATIDGEVVGY